MAAGFRETLGSLAAMLTATQSSGKAATDRLLTRSGRIADNDVLAKWTA